MEENKILSIKRLLYDCDNDEVKATIPQISDQEVLYMYAYNYNWDNGFEIPQEILNNDICNLSIALLIFYRADGLSYLLNKADNPKLPQWSLFIEKLYESIIGRKYRRGDIEFKIPLSQIQVFKLKKLLVEQEMIFINDIEGINRDIAL